LAQAVKDAAGAAQPFILDRLGQLCYPPKPPFSDGLFVVLKPLIFHLQSAYNIFSSSSILGLDFLFVGFILVTTTLPQAAVNIQRIP
jgi:hypothetical protein